MIKKTPHQKARGLRANPRIVAAHLAARRFGPAMAGALHCLAADPNSSYRAAARSHGVDVADLHRAASTVPGLSALRKVKR